MNLMCRIKDKDAVAVAFGRFFTGVDCTENPKIILSLSGRGIWDSLGQV